MLMQRLRLLCNNILEADREERVDNLRALADDYERKAREIRREITKTMSEPIVARMREAGL